MIVYRANEGSIDADTVMTRGVCMRCACLPSPQMTVEPWAVDQQVYNRDTTRDTEEDERLGGGDEEIGSTSHADRARLRQVDRPGFYYPNWENWAAMLSA